MSNQKSYIYWAACGARPIMISVLGCLRRKTYSRGREDTRSGTEKRCSHKWFRSILPCKNIFLLPSPGNPEGVAYQEGYLLPSKRFDHITDRQKESLIKGAMSAGEHAL